MFHGEQSPRNKHPDILAGMMAFNNFLLHFFVEDFDENIVAERLGLFELFYQVFVGVLVGKEGYSGILIYYFLLLGENFGQHHLFLAEQLLWLFFVEDDVDEFAVIFELIVILDTEDILHYFLLLGREHTLDVIICLWVHLSQPRDL